jgi:hypothetical protein
MFSRRPTVLRNDAEPPPLLIHANEPTAADAWEEGYEAAYGDLLDRDPHRTKNPYAQGETP